MKNIILFLLFSYSQDYEIEDKRGSNNSSGGIFNNGQGNQQGNGNGGNGNHYGWETPLGQALIEWKGWKESDSYSLTIGNNYVGEGWNLDDAKRLAKEWLINKHKELSVLLGF